MYVSIKYRSASQTIIKIKIFHIYGTKNRLIMLSPSNLHFPGIFPATICWRWESDISMRYLVFSVFYLWPGPRPYITAHHWRQREAAEVAEVSFYSYLCSAVTRLRPDPEPRLSSGRVTWHAARYVTCHAVTQRRASGIIMGHVQAERNIWSYDLLGLKKGALLRHLRILTRDFT